jgi:Lipopolysaccharide-assembly
MSSCQHRLSVASSIAPTGEAVGVRPALNLTQEANVEVMLTRALRQKLAEHGELGVESSTLQLESTVVGVSSVPLVASTGRLPNYRLAVAVEVVLRRDGVEQKRVSLSAQDDYPAGADALFSETNRSLALERATNTITTEALERLAQ